MKLSKKLAAFDRQPETMAAASKEAWECESYQEWLASLPEEQQAEEDDDD